MTATVAAPRKTNYAGILIVALLGLVLTMWALARMGGEPSAPDNTLALAMSHVFVQQRLKAPATADFAPMSQSTITDLGAGRWRVTAWVDSENSFGARLRTGYVAVLRWTGGDDWQLESLTFDE
jgi:hypothetical protein